MLIQSAFSATARWACHAAMGYDVEEEHVLRGLHRAGLPRLARSLTRALGGAGWRSTVGGVLCHKGVYVSWPPGSKTPSCEIGDLLFIVRRRDRNASWINRALLLQLKTGPGNLTRAQSELYSTWPEFGYQTKPTPRRLVTPTGVPHDGALFGRFDVGCSSIRGPWPSWEFSVSWPGTPEHPWSAVEEVQRMFAGRGGRGFLDKAQLISAGKATDWDAVIWDILERTAAAQYHGLARGVGTETFLAMSAAPALPDLLRYTAAGQQMIAEWPRLVESATTMDPAATHDRHVMGPAGDEVAHFDDDASEGVSTVIIELDRSQDT